MSTSAVSSQRIRATPYARRLARDRNLPLSAIAGSGPNGRITGDDLRRHSPPTAESPALARSEVATKPVEVAPASTPSAIVARVEFAALDRLLSQIADVRPDVSREDICLKAAAVALREEVSLDPHGTILLLTAPDQQRHLAGLAEAAVGAVAAMRERPAEVGDAALAVSFIGRTGIRPVAAKLIARTAARLVVGSPDSQGCADCLLSYDPAKLADDNAEDYLAAFRDLVEAPFRLLV